MYKFFLIPVLIVLKANVILAQPDSDAIFKKNTIGFGIGHTNYTIHGSQVDLEASFPGGDSFVERRTGFRINIEFRQMLTANLFLQEGLSYIQKGGYHRSSGFVDPARAEISYLQIPIMVGIGGGGEKFFMGVLGGLAANIEVSSGNTTTGSGWISDSYNKRDIIPSFTIGGFMDITLNKDLLFSANFNYDNDLSALVERSLNGEEYEIKLKGFSISAGLKLALTK